MNSGICAAFLCLFYSTAVVTRWYRAPELLCESDMYGTPVDVWVSSDPMFRTRRSSSFIRRAPNLSTQACGCIFAEILGRKPIFKGISTKDQLEVIVSKLGAPSEEVIRGVASRTVIDVLRRGAHRDSVPWAGQLLGWCKGSFLNAPPLSHGTPPL